MTCSASPPVAISITCAWLWNSRPGAASASWIEKPHCSTSRMSTRAPSRPSASPSVLTISCTGECACMTPRTLARSGVTPDERLVDGDAEARAVRDLDLAVDHGELLVDQLVEQRVGAERVLEDEAGALARGQGEAGGEGGRAGPEMRRQPQVEGRRDGGDADAFRQAAGDREVGLQDVGAALLGDLAEVVARELALPGRDRHRRRAADLGEADLVVGRHRFLEPVEILILHHPAERLGLGHGPRAVRVGHELDVRPQRSARGAHAGGRPVGLAVHHADAHLDRAKPALLHVAEELVADPRLVGPASGRVRGHARGAPAAEQTPDRRAQRLAEDVPERQVDAGDGGDREPAPSELRQHVTAVEGITLTRRVVQDLPQPADVARILTDEERGEVTVDDGGQTVGRGRAADAGLRLAPAHEPGVRVDLDDHGVERRDRAEVARVLALRRARHVHPRGVDGRDLHGLTPAVTSYSAVRTAPLAVPIFVLCDTRTYLIPLSRAASSRIRPTLVVMPPSASRSRRGCGRNGSSWTVMSRRGADGRPPSPPSNSRNAAATSAGEARRPSDAVTASVWPSVTAARVHVALTGNVAPRILPVSRATFSSSPGM